MTCRVAILPQPATSARDRFGQINQLAVKLVDGLETDASNAELRRLAVDIQNQACIGAAYERRRERGETINEGAVR